MVQNNEKCFSNFPLRYPKTSPYWFFKHFPLNPAARKLAIIRIIFYWFSPKIPILFFISPHKLFHFMNHQRDFYAHYHHTNNRVLCLPSLRRYRQPHIKNSSSWNGKTKRSISSPLSRRHDGDTDIEKRTSQIKRETALPSSEGPLRSSLIVYFYQKRQNISWFIFIDNQGNRPQMGLQIPASYSIKKKEKHGR